MTQEEKILFLRQEERIRFLEEENKSFCLRITELEALLKAALDKLNKDSHNSSKPPSSDRFRKIQSLRSASGKKPGGQIGHEGTTLKMSEHPDDIIIHNAERCSHCHEVLSNTPTDHYEKRQVYDLPPLGVRVTEHRCEVKTCPYCGEENKGSFPALVAQPVQYGPRLKGLCVYLTNYQLLPYHRCAQLLEDLLGHHPSEAALVGMSKSCAFALRPFEQEVRKVLCRSEVIHCDETGYAFCGQRNWLHVVATQRYTYYYAHEKRGKAAMEDMGILTVYKGVAMHDYWGSYLDYACDHVFCHAHHLRDLTFCIEQEKSHWAEEMKALLLQIKTRVDEERQSGECCLRAEVFGQYQSHYWELIQRGKTEHPLPCKQQGRRGRTAKSKARNLLERFMAYGAEMLRFACDFTIPFSNNVAEQAVRMMKVKQKISGCFRSKEGAQSFALIRSYIDTVRKQSIPILESLRNLMIGEPWLPLLPAPA